MSTSNELLSAYSGFQAVSVEYGVGGGASGTEPTYIAMCHYQFDSVDNFLAVFNANRSYLLGDMPNYTDLEATIQISEVALSR